MGIMKNKKILQFIKKKKPLVCLTAYSTYMAQIIDNYCDLILVGDSLGMVIYGDSSTKNVSLQTMINHGKAVRKGISKSLLVVDMPKGTYENSPNKALKNAKKIFLETKCDAVKVEGGKAISNIIKKLVSNNIPVMAHIGLLPQHVSKPQDYKVKGRNIEEEESILNDLLAVQEAGAFSVVIEAVQHNLAEKLCRLSKIKTIGIGASKSCDGQILVTEDLLGFFDKNAKFVKKYENLKARVSNCILRYKNDVIKKKFPTIKNIYY